jgi:hypothetical protein
MWRDSYGQWHVLGDGVGGGVGGAWRVPLRILIDEPSR